jgi:hypothetical protein
MDYNQLSGLREKYPHDPTTSVVRTNDKFGDNLADLLRESAEDSLSGFKNVDGLFSLPDGDRVTLQIVSIKVEGSYTANFR